MSHSVNTTLIDTVGPFDLYERTDGALFVAITGTTVPVGSAWRPAADNEDWFAWRAPLDPRRVESRDAAIDYITTEESTR